MVNWPVLYYSTGHKCSNSFSSYFPDKSHFLPYNLCIVYHVEMHQNSSGNVVDLASYRVCYIGNSTCENWFH